MIPNRVLKEFPPEVAPVIMDISPDTYNRSSAVGYVPDLPKVSPPQEIQSRDLRPITLTCTIAKVICP